MRAASAVRTWSGSLWTNAKNAVLSAAADPESELRTRLAGIIRDGARLLQNDPTVRELVQRHSHTIAGYLVEARIDTLEVHVTAFDDVTATRQLDRAGVKWPDDVVFLPPGAVQGIPDGDPVDLISALVQTRDWNLKPGEKRDILVQFGRDFYPLTLTAEGYEEVRTPLGTYQTLVLVPRMEKDPKGLFKKGGEIKVWISQDLSNLPVKMQLKLNFGAATLLLSGYKAPAAVEPK